MIVESPCVRNCCLDEQDVCLGCGRSIDDILEWSGADSERRRVILQGAQQRLVLIRRRR
jgi:predicted Fe-S protein YdhL (DUF1289 family)